MPTHPSRDIGALTQVDDTNSQVTVKRKIIFGGDGTFTDVTNSTPFPVAVISEPTTPSIVAATASLTQISDSASSVVLLAANSSRKGFMLQNNSSAIARVAFAATSSSSAFSIQIAANGFYERVNGAIYQGIISCIWATAPGGKMQITEL